MKIRDVLQCVIFLFLIFSTYGMQLDARYYDPRLGRWITVDRPLPNGEYFPMPPINEEATKHNNNLPGMGGVLNFRNLDLYQYA